jgi:hypothetical protein
MKNIFCTAQVTLAHAVRLRDHFKPQVEMFSRNAWGNIAQEGMIAFPWRWDPALAVRYPLARMSIRNRYTSTEFRQSSSKSSKFSEN